jgi:cytochrome c biogenesis protein CcmG, thiol:disulfide interchange protein DsbE
MSAVVNPARRSPWLLLPLAAVFTLGLLLALNLREKQSDIDAGRDSKELPSPLVGKPIPAFTTTDLTTGVAISTAALRGTPFILNVWASWCAVCQIEHPTFNSYAKTPGAVPVVGLNYKDADADAKRWIAQLGNPYQQIAVDINGAIGMDLGVYGAPETYFVDAAGVIVHKHIGEMTPAVLAEQTARLTGGVSAAAQ